jgi:hypothetical protein
MDIILNIMFMTIITALINSCGHNINPEEIFMNENEFILKIYKDNNNLTDTIILDTINKSSAKISRLNTWFLDNSDGWESSVASYSLPDISLTSDDSRLLIYKNGIIIGYTDINGNPKQFSKKIKASEFDFLTK